MSVRGTLLDQHVKEAAVDYDAGLAYFVPGDGYTAQQAIEALAQSGKYKAQIKD